MIMSNYNNEIEDDSVRFIKNKWTKWEINKVGVNGRQAKLVVICIIF